MIVPSGFNNVQKELGEGFASSRSFEMSASDTSTSITPTFLRPSNTGRRKVVMALAFFSSGLIHPVKMESVALESVSHVMVQSVM